MALTGECFCGEIRYRIEGDIHDARSCHCSRCRKAFSGAGSAYGLVTPGEFRWTAGESLLTAYIGDQGAGLAFCSQCGTTLVGIVGDAIHGVTLGSLNNNPPVVLQRHIFTGSKASWDHIGGDVPQYEAFPED